MLVASARSFVFTPFDSFGMINQREKIPFKLFYFESKKSLLTTLSSNNRFWNFLCQQLEFNNSAGKALGLLIWAVQVKKNDLN